MNQKKQIKMVQDAAEIAIRAQVLHTDSELHNLLKITIGNMLRDEFKLAFDEHVKFWHEDEHIATEMYAEASDKIQSYEERIARLELINQELRNCLGKIDFQMGQVKKHF